MPVYSLGWSSGRHTLTFTFHFSASEFTPFLPVSLEKKMPLEFLFYFWWLNCPFVPFFQRFHSVFWLTLCELNFSYCWESVLMESKEKHTNCDRKLVWQSIENPRSVRDFFFSLSRAVSSACVLRLRLRSLSFECHAQITEGGKSNEVVNGCAEGNLIYRNQFKGRRFGRINNWKSWTFCVWEIDVVSQSVGQ